MSIKNEILKGIKKNFFPFKGIKLLESAIESKFSKKSIFIKKIYNKQIILINERSYNIFFIYNKEDLVILFITDSNIKNYNYSNKIELNSLSITKIDIISSDKWSNTNSNMIEETIAISKNSLNPILEYYLRNNEISSFKKYYLNSPFYWQSIESYKKIRSSTESKTKGLFIQNTIKTVINLLSNKGTIFDLDLNDNKMNLFQYLFKGLIDRRSLNHTYNNIINNRHKLFNQFFYSKLFSSSKYNIDEWNLYFDMEIIPYFLDEFKQSIYLFSTDEKIIGYIKNIICHILSVDINFKGSNHLLYRAVFQILLEEISEQEFLSFFDEFSEYIDKLFHNKEIFQNNYSNDLIEVDIFYPTILDKIKSSEKYQSALKKSEETPILPLQSLHLQIF